jgi:Cupin-like domain
MTAKSVSRYSPAVQRVGTIREIEAGTGATSDTDDDLDLTTPVVLRGRAAGWTAPCWTPLGIAELNEGMLLPVWALDGNNPLPVGRVEVPIETYAGYVIHGDPTPIHAEARKYVGPAQCDRNNLHYYSGSIPFTALSAATGTAMRLGELPHLSSDGRGHDTVENLWFGRRRGAVGLHWDGRLGYVVQLDGTKAVTVAHPEQRQWLYPEPHWDGPNSRVSPDAVDLHRFPRARHAESLTGTIDPGDVLVLPAGWWHHLTSVTTHATSVNVWLSLD